MGHVNSRFCVDTLNQALFRLRHFDDIIQVLGAFFTCNTAHIQNMYLSWGFTAVCDTHLFTVSCARNRWKARGDIYPKTKDRISVWKEKHTIFCTIKVLHGLMSKRERERNCGQASSRVNEDIMLDSEKETLFYDQLQLSTAFEREEI